MAAITAPPSTVSIFQYPPNFPSGVVNDQWIAWFKTVQANTLVYPSAVAGYALGWDALGNLVNVPNTGADQTAVLADTTLATNGAGRIGYNGALPYAAGTLGNQVSANVTAIASRLVAADAANLTDATKGAGMIGFLSSLAYAAGTVGAFLKSLGSNTGASLIGYLAPYTGAVGRTQASKNADTVSLHDIGGIGDGVTSNATAIASAEAGSETTVALPEGVYVVPAGTALTKKYVGPGALVIGGERHTLNQYQQLQNPIFSSVVAGDLSAFYTAIAKKACTVVIWGDSISEGINQINYEDSWPALLKRELQAQCPGVVWTLVNLSIAGMGMGNAASDTYVGSTYPETPGTNFYRAAGSTRVPPNYDLWPIGSTVGKTWKDHVKDAAPDLVIFALGQNDTSGDGASFATLMKNMIIYARSWVKPPSVAIMPTPPPSRLSVLASLRNNIQVSADAARGVAYETGCTLLDANRVWLSLLDGVDNTSLRKRGRNGFEALPTGWVGAPTLPSVASDVATFTTSTIAVRKLSERDVRISATFTPALAATVCGIQYRINPLNLNQGYALQAYSSTLILYWNLSSIASVAIPARVDGTPYVIDVVAIGCHHMVYVDGVKYIDIYDYNSIVPGYYGVQFAGAGTVSNLVARAGNARIVGHQALSESDLVGVNDFASNVDSIGGDAIHHPSQIGHYSAYFQSCLGLVETARKTANHYRPPVATASAAATTGALAQTDYIEVIINSTGPGAVFVSGDATHIGASSSHVYYAPSVSSIAISIKQNGTTTLVSTTLTFPFAGNWTVYAVGSVSENAGVIRHVITAFAVSQS